MLIHIRNLVDDAKCNAVYVMGGIRDTLKS